MLQLVRTFCFDHFTVKKSKSCQNIFEDRPTAESFLFEVNVRRREHVVHRKRF